MAHAEGMPSAPDAHPLTGEQFVEVNVQWERDVQRHRMPPPVPPGAMTEEWTNDGESFFRPWGPGEQEGAAVLYSFARAEYRRTGGLHFVAGAVTVRFNGRTASGATAEALHTPRGWDFTAATY